MTKEILRKHAKNIRAKKNIDEISCSIVEKIRLLPEWDMAENIMLYYPCNNEINLLGLLDKTNKKWFLPRVSGNEIDVYYYNLGDTLEENKWLIPEPLLTADKVKKNELDMVILPGLCADKKGYRLGYGFGFYDRFIRDLSARCIKIFPVLDELLLEDLPKDIWDEPVNIIVTQRGVYTQKNA